MKCWANGVIVPKISRFELKKADCGPNICAVMTGPAVGGDPPMLTCGPKFKTGEKAETGGVVTNENGSLCKCDDAHICA